MPGCNIGTALFFAAEPGRAVAPSRAVDGEFLWCAWLLERPLEMCFVSAHGSGEVRVRDGVVTLHPPHFAVTLQAPLKCSTHFEVASHMLRHSAAREHFLYQIGFTDVSISTVKVDSVLQTLCLSAGAVQNWGPKDDELEAALRELAKPAVSVGRRFRGKQAVAAGGGYGSDGSDAPSSNDVDQDSDKELIIPAAIAPAASSAAADAAPGSRGRKTPFLGGRSS